MTTISTFLASSLNRLKKGVFTLLILLSSLTLFSQGGQKFSDAGNILSTSSFIGSTNAMPFVIKTNNTQKAVFTTTGWFGLGITAPTCMFDVFGDGKINNFNVLFNQTIGSTLNVPKIFSPTGTVDFDGNKITTTNEIIAGKVTTPKIWSASSLIDFDGCNLKTTAGITGASLLISGNSTLGSLTANSFQNPLFAGVTNGLILSDANGNFQKLDFNGNQNSYLRGDGTFGSLSGTSTWDTIYANAIIGGYVNATKSIQLDGSITAGSRGTGTIGEYSIVVGGPEPMYGYTTSPVASGKYSVSFGTANESSNLGSMSFGGGNVSSGLFSFAIGGNNISSGNLSVTIGSNNTASGGNSTVIGYNNIAEGKQSAIIGGTGNTLNVDAMNSAIIGGTGISATQPNTVYVPNFISNGNVGIGIETPIEKLDVNGNANIRGYLYVQDGVIIGKRIDGQRVTSDTIIADKIDVARKLKAMELEAKTLQIEKVTADTLKTDNMTLLLMQADSITAQKMTLDKLAINNIKADIEITSKDINIGEKGKFGNNIIIDGLTNNITTPGIITAGSITANTMNVLSQSITNLQVNGGIKVGSSSIILGAYTGTGGIDNNIFTENDNLYIQSIATTSNHTILNNNNGNVGIGSLSPYKKLTVNGDVSFANYNISGSGNSGDGFSGLEILGNNQIPTRRGVSLDPDPNGSFNFFINSNQSSAGFNFKNNHDDGSGDHISNLMTITSSGDVGIGTTIPQKTLHVKTTHQNTGGSEYMGSMRIENEVLGGSTSVWDFEPYAGNISDYIDNLRFVANGNTSVMTLFEDGKVGIGSTNAIGTLQVGNSSSKVVIGDGFAIPLPDAYWNASYLGFNTGRDNSGNWIFDTDGAHNGGNVMLSTIFGDIRFISIPTTNAGTSSKFLTDQQLLTYTKMVINSSGVGIGTDNPTADLEVVGTIKCTGINMNGNEFNNVWTQSGENIFTNTTGNVGIGTGTSTPYKKLTVNGDVSFANYNNSGSGNPGDGYSGLEILGNDQIPLRRGISLNTDPHGYFNFFINSNQGPSGFNFKNGNGNATLLTILQDGKVGIGTNSPMSNLDIISTSPFGGLSLSGTKSFISFFSGTFPTSFGFAQLGFINNDQNFFIHNADGSNANLIFSNWNSLAVDGVIQGQSTTGSGDVIRIGNDSKLVDIDIQNTIGLYGIEDITVASLKLGSSGGTISGYNGFVGIGTTIPSAKLEIHDGDLLLKGQAWDAGDIIFRDGAGTQFARIWSAVGMAGLGLSSGDNNPDIFIDDIGRVGIGTDSPTEKLDVKGNIKACKVYVSNPGGGWCDYVFDEKYRPSSLYEVEKFIKQNKHLPDVPSEKEVMQNGIDVGEMNKILLKKIEELTLYSIEQQKQIDELIKLIKKN